MGLVGIRWNLSTLLTWVGSGQSLICSIICMGMGSMSELWWGTYFAFYSVWKESTSFHFNGWRLLSDFSLCMLLVMEPVGIHPFVNLGKLFFFLKGWRILIYFFKPTMSTVLVTFSVNTLQILKYYTCIKY